MASPMAQPEPLLQDRPLEDLNFRGSPEVSLGVELELQVLDRETGDLVPGAQRILDACADEQTEGVSGEFLLSMLEVRTGICRSVAEVRESLFPLLRRVRNIASSVGYDLAIGGTHPFARPSASAVSPDERYQRIRKHQGWLAYQEAMYGLHVHIGVPGGDEAIGLINLLVQYVPHLLALSANSPFWQGIDTGFASSRSPMFRPAGHAGIPQHFRGWEDFCRFCRVLHGAGLIAGTKDIYWDIRPRPQTGTIEFRIFDAPASLSRLLGLAALARCLVIDGLRRLERQPRWRRGDPRRFWLAKENKWLAARYGSRAACVRQPGGPRLSLGDDTARLLERLLPLAREVGEAYFLSDLYPPERLESGADRQRQLYRQTGDWEAIIDDMKSRWVAELDELVPEAATPSQPSPSKPATAPGSPGSDTA